MHYYYSIHLFNPLRRHHEVPQVFLEDAAPSYDPRDMPRVSGGARLIECFDARMRTRQLGQKCSHIARARKDNRSRVAHEYLCFR